MNLRKLMTDADYKYKLRNKNACKLLRKKLIEKQVQKSIIASGINDLHIIESLSLIHKFPYAFLSLWRGIKVKMIWRYGLLQSIPKSKSTWDYLQVSELSILKLLYVYDDYLIFEYDEDLVTGTLDNLNNILQFIDIESKIANRDGIYVDFHLYDIMIKRGSVSHEDMIQVDIDSIEYGDCTPRILVNDYYYNREYNYDIYYDINNITEYELDYFNRANHTITRINGIACKKD